MHMCTAYIAIAGDIGQVVYRGKHNPVSWPEVGLLQFIHGEDAVYNVEAFEDVKVSNAAEKLRLIGIYGTEVVEHVYPGRSPAMETSIPNTDLSDAKSNKKVHPRSDKKTIIPPLETEDEE